MKFGKFIAVFLLLLSSVFFAINLIMMKYLNCAIGKLIIVVPVSFCLGIAFFLFPGEGLFQQIDTNKPVLKQIWNKSKVIEKIAWFSGGIIGFIIGIIVWYNIKLVYSAIC